MADRVYLLICDVYSDERTDSDCVCFFTNEQDATSFAISINNYIAETVADMRLEKELSKKRLICNERLGRIAKFYSNIKRHVIYPMDLAMLYFRVEEVFSYLSGELL